MALYKIFFVSNLAFILLLFSATLYAEQVVPISVDNKCDKKILIGVQGANCICEGTCYSSVEGESLPNAKIKYQNTCKVRIFAEEVHNSGSGDPPLFEKERPPSQVRAFCEESKDGCSCYASVR